jgi:tetratricopeptide (TPR) repeat protein
VRERAAQALDREEGRLLDIALDHLSLGRAAWGLGEPGHARTQLEQAVDGLRQAGDLTYLPHGLLARAALFREARAYPAARRDLDEAMRIAKRSEMRLFQCDAHLEYARLALMESEKEQAGEHVAAAQRLVEETGYGRRRPEVEELGDQVR